MTVVKFTVDTYKNCVSAEDFYKAVGLYPAIKAGKVHSVYQMKINPKTYKEIEFQMQNNWNKNPHTRFMKKNRAYATISFDWMNFSPVQEESIPENEIWCE